jgi:hypothetical protein
MRFFRFFLSFLLASAATLAPASVLAQKPPTAIVVVDAPPDEGGLDASRLRAEVGAELGAEAVAPTDPRAAQASGTVRVSVDRAAHALVVEYRGQAEPITRRVELPADAEATERAAVLLAGNLARDEASELAAALRKPKETPPVGTESAVPEEVSRAELARLGAALEVGARSNRTRRTLADGALWTGLGAVAASGGIAVYGSSTNAGWTSDTSLALLQSSVALMAVSLVLRPASYDELGALYARERAQGLPASLIVDDVEHAWLRDVHREHSTRRLIGWLAIGSGALEWVLSDLLIAARTQEPTGGPSWGGVAAWSGIAATDITLGVYMVVTDGPLEHAFHDYETSVGRRIRSSESASLAPFVAPAPGGGGVAGLGGRF